MFSGLDHFGFAVSNLDRSIAFYTLLLEQEPFLRKVWDVDYLGRLVGYPHAKLDAAFWRLPGGTLLELMQYLSPPPGHVDMETYNAGNAHLCLVSEDIQSDLDRVCGHAELRSPEPIDIPWGPYKGGRVAYIRDEDGISIELMQLPTGGPVLPDGF